MPYNKLILLGNLTRDPQLNYLPNNTAAVDFGIAVNRTWQDASGQKREEVLFLDCRAFGKTAENINKFFKKGDPIHLDGRLELNSWEDKEGNKRSKHRMFVESFCFVGNKSAGESKPAPPRQSPTPPPAANSDAGFDGDFGGGAGNDDIPFAPMENI